VPSVSRVDRRRIQDQRRHFVSAQPIVLAWIERVGSGQLGVVIDRFEGKLVHPDRDPVSRSIGISQGPVEGLFESAGHFFWIQHTLRAPRKIPKNSGLRGLDLSPWIRFDRILEMSDKLAH
jgi:hypothetical protein